MFAKFPNDARPRRSAVFAALASLVLLLTGGTAHAVGNAPVLGKNGDVYLIAGGSYGSLFPDGGGASAHADVLRLEVRRGAGAVENHLVPGSESEDSDRTPFLFFDDSSDRLYVVWSSSNASTLTRINLASFDGSAWSDTIEVSGNIYSEKSAPRLAVTHDHFRLATGTVDEPSTRTILHVVWSESAADGGRTMYAPVVLIDGELASTWRRVHRLNDYVAQGRDGAALGAEVAARLLSSPTVDAATESNAVVIGFADNDTGTLAQLEIATPATELSELADSVAEHIESSNLCQRLANDEPDALRTVAEAARVHIVVAGRRIRHRVLSPLSQDVKGLLMDRGAALCAEGGLASLTSAARVHIVVVGAKAQEGELLKSVEESRTAASRTPRVILAAAQEVGDGYVQHLARLQVKSERAAPPIGDGEPTIFVSPKGVGAVVVWEKGKTLTYVETGAGSAADEAWSSPYTLKIGGGLSRSEAYSMLRDRARSLE